MNTQKKDNQLMSFVESLALDFDVLTASASDLQKPLERFKAEIAFASQIIKAHSSMQAEWEALIRKSVQGVSDALKKDVSPEKAVKDAEQLLQPIGAAAKKYTIHCIGHAHLDMNWMWDWPETVAAANDTFTTVDRLMDEFPTFTFSQSQASLYQIMKDYLPELYARVKKRVAEGRWEVIASQWVEGDKNMASGEILYRHLLYTRRFFKEEFDLEYDSVTIDWQPDTFGHPQSIPTILAHGGVKRYYFHRGNHGPQLFWWQGKDGSRVLAFDDWHRGYNGIITPNIVNGLMDFEQATGLKDYLYVYGVGDHGGGPTREDLMMALRMDDWPIFPNIKFSTTDAFYTIAEKEAKNLPVLDDEMNFILEGCYTSESNVKFANRKSENALVEAEMASLLAKSLAGMPYPAEALQMGWRHAMFNQFHDILPGSGVHATYEYAQGLFQDIMAQTTMAKTRALRLIASMVNTQSLCQCPKVKEDGPGSKIGPGIGGGMGDIPAQGLISRRGPGSACCDPFVIFNPSPWERTEVITTRIWDRPWHGNQIAVIDESGDSLPVQMLNRNDAFGYWGHKFIEIAFPVKKIPGAGYRSFTVMKKEGNITPSGQFGPSPRLMIDSVTEKVEPGIDSGCTGDGKGVLENEFYRVEVEQKSGAIIHLIDKKTGIDAVPKGERFGMLEYMLEAPHGMTAWVFGQIVKHTPFESGATLEFPHNGPYLASVRSRHKMNDSTFTLTVTLATGVPRVDFQLDVNWLERGDDKIGVPCLQVAFPVAIDEVSATAETPNCFVKRSTNPTDLRSFTYDTLTMYGGVDPHVPRHSVDAPMQKWVDITGTHSETEEHVGVTVVNDSKYGYSVDGNMLRIDLLRSSYDPDPLPELGQHTIRFAVIPHVGAWSVSDATREGYNFNLPFNVVGAGLQEGSLPAQGGYIDILTPNIMVSALKKAEDSDALIIRLYEMEGKATAAKVRIDYALLPKNCKAVETDALEQPLSQSSAEIHGDVLRVSIPAFGMTTVKLG
jgi:alpha-mannosidase